MKQEHLTMEGVLAAYPKDKFIHIVPAVSKHQLGVSMYGLDVATVKIDPHDEKMVYVLKSTGWGDDEKITEMGLTAAALNKIAGAADVNVVPETMVDDPDRGLLIVRSHAIMRTPGGSVRSRTAQVRWERDIMKERLWARAVAYYKKAVSAGWGSVKGKTPEQLNELVKEKFDREWLDEREFGPRKAESKAARNAIKLLLGVPDAWHPRELDEKEFAVVKYVFAPDMSDPAVRDRLLEAGLRSQQALFGVNLAVNTGSQFLPAQSTAAIALPAPSEADVVDVTDEGEEALEASVSADAPAPSEGQSEGEVAAPAASEDAPSAGAWGSVEAMTATQCVKLIQKAQAAGVKQRQVDDWLAALANISADQDGTALMALYREVREAK